MISTAPIPNEALRAIVGAVVDSIREAGSMGAPSGIVFAALNAHGVDLDTYNQFIAALVNAGKLTRKGDLLYAV